MQGHGSTIGARWMWVVLVVAAAACVLALPTARATSGGAAPAPHDHAAMLRMQHAAATAKPGVKQPVRKALVRHGLTATYFRGTTLKLVALRRTDARIDFRWRSGAPARGLPRDGFSTRWQGLVEAPKFGTYTFTAQATDGIRVWVDGKLRINRWGRTRSARNSAAAMQLTAGRHKLRVDYFEATGVAAARLLWRGPGIRQQVVPTARLYPMGTTVPAQCADKLDNDGDRRIDSPKDLDCTSTKDRTESAVGEPVGLPWSDPATWGGAVPADGTSVTVPAGKVITLDRDVSLANLTIDGVLVFARRDLTIDTDWIVVHGKLQVGSDTTPFAQRAVIRLRDLTPGEDVMGMGDKVLGVMGGTLELHGQRRPGWTKLAATAAKGATQITLATSPGWRVGDRIAIASTDYDRKQSEEFTITAVSGATLTLDKPLAWMHFGVLQTIAGRSVDERAEVGLLTRNITFEGEELSSAKGFGAYIMVMNDGAVAHVDGVELNRVGQLGLLRRYPLHFHMLRAGGAGSYFSGSSVHASNNRCVTIHGTNGVVLDGNVCYDHVGHGFFFEDGGEQGNTLTNNLGFGTRAAEQGKQVIPTDRNPATFWITNPDNVVRGNVAAGSDSTGFWIALPQHPTGLFAKLYPAETARTWNRRIPLGQFASNTAHSNGGDGLNLDNGPRPDGTTEATYYNPHADPTNDKSAEVVTSLTGLVSYKNRSHGAWLRGTNARLVGATLADNAIGSTFASDESWAQDSLYVGETANTGTPQSWEARAGNVGRGGRSLPQPWDADFPIRGFEFYDGSVGSQGTTFANFQPYTDGAGAVRQQSALGYHVDDDFSIHPKNFVSGATFVNAKRVYLEAPEVGHDGDVSAVFLDTDGSVAGTPGRSIMTRNPFLYGSGCTNNDDWGAMLCSGGDYATLHVGAPDAGHAAVAPVKLTRPDGAVQTLMANTDDDADTATSTVLTGSAYTVDFTGGTPVKSRYVLANGNGTSVELAIPHGPSFRVSHYGCDMSVARQWCFGAAASLAALRSSTKSGYFYDTAAGVLRLKLASGDSDWDELVVE
ncbi:MAG: hypothetical protein JWN72_158 [Thermoleophilia bacterium]|nr:hypothetical protein [Thermoleophilia bacterium]